MVVEEDNVDAGDQEQEDRGEMEEVALIITKVRLGEIVICMYNFFVDSNEFFMVPTYLSTMIYLMI